MPQPGALGTRLPEMTIFGISALTDHIRDKICIFLFLRMLEPEFLAYRNYLKMCSSLL